MTCPYCKVIDVIPDVVIKNVESYGSNWVRFPCLNCKKIVKAYARVEVHLSNVTITNEKSDFA